MHLSRPAAVLLGAASALLLAAAPSWAHVTVNSPGATQGGFAKLAFRVPTEKAVPTTRLQIAFPVEAPIPFVSVKPHAGWSYKVTKGKAPTGLTAHGEPVDEVVTGITWTATGVGIKAGEFDEFEVSAGPLPAVSSMVFKALQTYSDGDVVRWIETGAGELEHPAPVLQLSPAAAQDPSNSPTPTVTVAATAGDSDDAEDDSDALGWVGLGAGVVGAVLGLAAFVRSGRRGNRAA